MALEYRISKGWGERGNPYQGRWRNWYTFIADWIIRNPGGKAEDCAKELHKHVNTIRFIMASDMFQDYFARRKEEWQRHHDYAIINKTTAVAEAALDLMLAKIEKQGDKIPMNLITDVATSALDRLGYAPRTAPSVEVNVNAVDNRKVVMVPISSEALVEARDAIRAAEVRRQIEHREKEAGAPDGSAPGSVAVPTEPAEAVSDRFRPSSPASDALDVLDPE